MIMNRKCFHIFYFNFTKSMKISMPFTCAVRNIVIMTANLLLIIYYFTPTNGKSLTNVQFPYFSDNWKHKYITL